MAATAPEASTSSPQNAESVPPLSKNARKKLLKAERFAASKAERRARDKEKKKERAEKRRAGDPDALEDAEERRAKRRKVEVTKHAPKIPFKARIVVDLAFDDKMTEKVKLCAPVRVAFVLLSLTCITGSCVAVLTTRVHLQFEPQVPHTFPQSGLHLA
jgi:hypothetical protein